MFKKILMALCGCLTFAGCTVARVEMPENAVLLDVRSEAEFASGAIPGAILMPHETVKDKISTVAPDKKTPIYIYCRSGRRAGVALKVLKELGYTDLHNLGGFEDARKSLGR